MGYNDHYKKEKTMENWIKRNKNKIWFGAVVIVVVSDVIASYYIIKRTKAKPEKTAWIVHVDEALNILED